MSCKEQMEAPKQALQLESSSKSFLIVTISLSIIAYIFGTYFIQLGEGSDWNEIRCQPHIMPIAGLYGYDVQENFNYCMNSQFNEQAKQYLGPVYQLFGGFVGVLGTLVEVSQKVKLAFATMFGGVKTIMQEFTERLKLFFIRIEVMSQRMKMLMYRVYSVMFAVIFMATSGLTAVSNFGGTVLFDVIDTFCFDPTTAIHIQRKGFEGVVSISNVQLGDVLGDGGKVTSVFSFLADGQAMVRLCDSRDCADGVLVSTNHYVQFNDKWIRSDEHPLADPAGRWAGGTAAPLICLNTTTNCIPINGFLFRDYDETAAAHYEAIRDIHEKLNGSQEPFRTQFGAGWTELLPSVSPLTKVRGSSGSKAWRTAIGIDLGDTLAGGSDASANVVVGKISHFVHQVCKLPYNGNYVGAGTLIYERDSDCWARAGDIYPVYKLQFPLIFNSFITLPGSVIELEHDYLIRDYLEIASPDTEAPYARALAALNG
jgi:hypothetical protein